MNRLIPDYLKLHLEDPVRAGDPAGLSASAAETSSADAVWRLMEIPATEGGSPPVRPGRAATPASGPFVRSIPRRMTGLPLSKRIEQLLQTAIEVTACDAAAAYLLDDSTSLLKLTASWGRPGRRNSHPQRPLRGQLGDLEALLGQAVVIQRAADAPEWRIPEDCGAAACVPIAGSAPLGTLWTFSPKPRTFSAEQIQMLDVVAGRIGAEAERENLLQESVVLKAWHRHWRRAVEWQQGQRPAVAPLADGWQIAAATSRTAPLVGGYHDWALLPNEQLAVAVGHAQGDAVESQLTLAALHAGLKSHSPYVRHPGQLLRRLNDTFWVGSAGDQFVALGYLMLDSQSGQFEFSAAGPVAALVVHEHDQRLLHGGLGFLGEDPDAMFDVRRGRLEPGEWLVLLHAVPGGYSARETALKDSAPLDAVLLAAVTDRPWAVELAGRVRELHDAPVRQWPARLEAAWRSIAGADDVEPTMVVVRREPSSGLRTP